MGSQFFDVYNLGFIGTQFEWLVCVGVYHWRALTMNIGRVDALLSDAGVGSVHHFLPIKLELHTLIPSLEQRLTWMWRKFYRRYFIRLIDIRTHSLHPSPHPNHVCAVIRRFSDATSPCCVHQRLEATRPRIAQKVVLDAHPRSIIGCRVLCRQLRCVLGEIRRELVGLRFAELLRDTYRPGNSWWQRGNHI